MTEYKVGHFISLFSLSSAALVIFEYQTVLETGRVQRAPKVLIVILGLGLGRPLETSSFFLAFVCLGYPVN